MIILLSIAIIVFGLWKTNIVSSVCSVFFMLWIITLVPHDIYSNNDYAAYLLAYQNPGNVSMEPGFTYILKGLSATGLSFDQARWILLITVVIIFWALFRWISNSWSLVLLGYLFSTFFIDQVQLRNTVMWALVFVGFCILLKKGLSKINILLFLILVFISGNIQSSGFLYFAIVLFATFFDKQVQPNRSIISEAARSFSFTLILYYMGHYLVTPFLNRIQSVLPIHFVEGYLMSDGKGGGQVDGMGLLIYPIQLGIIVTILVLLIRELEKNSYEGVGVDTKVLDGIVKFNYFLIPFIGVNFNFFRLLRNEWILIILLIVVLNRYRRKGYLSFSMLLGSLAVFFTGLWWSSGLVYTNIIVPTVSNIFSYIN